MAAAWGGRGEIVKYLLKDLQCNVNVIDVVRLRLIYKNTVLCIIAKDSVLCFIWIPDRVCVLCGLVLTV